MVITKAISYMIMKENVLLIRVKMYNEVYLYLLNTYE